MPAKELQRRPEAGAESVEDLVDRVLRGEVRIPTFQRPLKWEATDVVDLFDSVYHGYPIGALLLRAAPAPAGPVRIGPLELFSPDIARALWVVDGQQRLTSLAAGLARPAPEVGQPMPRDAFVVFFDPRTERFHSPPASGAVPSGWVPVWRLRDAAALSEWIIQEWTEARDARLRAVVFEAAKRLREYRVPYYVIETPDEEIAKVIFDRVNTRGKQLERADVFNALFGHKGTAPSTLGELADELACVGMGAPDEQSQLLPGLVALRGLDVTRPFAELAHDHPDEFTGVIAEAAPVFRRVLGFLRVHAEVPHLRLLPYSTPLIVLVRFFALHPEPNQRTLTLLVRWTWRSFLSPSRDDRTLRRRGVSSIGGDEESSVQAMLALVASNRAEAYRLPERFDARAAESRMALLALAAERPRTLAEERGETPYVDIAAAIESRDKDAFRPVFSGSGGALSSPANRILLGGVGAARQALRTFVDVTGTDNAVLHSHLISPESARALVRNDADAFVELRAIDLARAVNDMGERLAEWGQNDRPSIEYLLAQGNLE